MWRWRRMESAESCYRKSRYGEAIHPVRTWCNFCRRSKVKEESFWILLHRLSWMFHQVPLFTSGWNGIDSIKLSTELRACDEEDSCFAIITSCCCALLSGQSKIQMSPVTSYSGSVPILINDSTKNGNAIWYLLTFICGVSSWFFLEQPSLFQIVGDPYAPGTFASPRICKYKDIFKTKECHAMK